MLLRATFVISVSNSLSNQLLEALLFDFVVSVICLHTSVVIRCVFDICEALC